MRINKNDLVHVLSEACAAHRKEKVSSNPVIKIKVYPKIIRIISVGSRSTVTAALHNTGLPITEFFLSTPAAIRILVDIKRNRKQEVDLNFCETGRGKELRIGPSVVYCCGPEKYISNQEETKILDKIRETTSTTPLTDSPSLTAYGTESASVFVRKDKHFNGDVAQLVIAFL